MLVRSGPNLSSEELAKKKDLVAKQFPMAKIIVLPGEYGVKITGISNEEEEEILSIIERKDENMTGTPATASQGTPVLAETSTPATVSQASAQADMVKAFQQFMGLVAKGETSSVAKKLEELQQTIVKTQSELNSKIDNTFSTEVSQRNLAIAESLKAYEENLNHYIGEAEGLIKKLEEKYQIVAKAWEDERTKILTDLKNREDGENKLAGNIVKIANFFKDFPSIA